MNSEQIAVILKSFDAPDEVRVMQGIVLGMTGSGKTTLLKNIITQDIARFVGPPEDRHHIPMVIFDGKGDAACT